MSYHHRSNYQLRQNSGPKRGMPQGVPPRPDSQQQQRQEDQNEEIPAFHIEDYAGFKDIILAASIPEVKNSSSIPQLQQTIETKVKLNGEVINSLLQVSNVLTQKNDFLAEPHFLSNTQFNLDQKTMDLQVIQNYSELLEQPINPMLETI